MLLLTKSLKESSCCRTSDFSAKKAEMTAHESSCAQLAGVARTMAEFQHTP